MSSEEKLPTTTTTNIVSNNDHYLSPQNTSTADSVVKPQTVERDNDCRTTTTTNSQELQRPYDFETIPHDTIPTEKNVSSSNNNKIVTIETQSLGSEPSPSPLRQNVNSSNTEPTSDDDDFSRRIREQLAPAVRNLTREYRRTTNEIAATYRSKHDAQKKLIENLQNRTCELESQLQRTTNDNIALQKQVAWQRDKTLQFARRKRVMNGARDFVRTLRERIGRRKGKEQFLGWIGRVREKKLLNKCFLEWNRFWIKARAKREQMQQELKLETITREIISRYEAELEKLRSGLSHAHQEIARVHVQRQQLEERMRRTFLQGMTAMNLETLHLFNDISSPKEQQQHTTTIKK